VLEEVGEDGREGRSVGGRREDAHGEEYACMHVLLNSNQVDLMFNMSRCPW